MNLSSGPTPPPSAWPPPATRAADAPGRMGRWQQRPRWQRWGAYTIAALSVSPALGAVVGDPDELEQRTDRGDTHRRQQHRVRPSQQQRLRPPLRRRDQRPTTTSSQRPQPRRRRPPRRPCHRRPRSPARCSPSMSSQAIPVENEQPDGYDRDLFAYGDTVDDRGCRTRALVLIRDSLTPAQVDPVGCAVVAGDWLSVYDGVTWSRPRRTAGRPRRRPQRSLGLRGVGLDTGATLRVRQRPRRSPARCAPSPVR